jgi:DNA-binding transcriptional regulator GbsR (MarR family)
MSTAKAINALNYMGICADNLREACEKAAKALEEQSDAMDSFTRELAEDTAADAKALSAVARVAADAIEQADEEAARHDTISAPPPVVDFYDPISSYLQTISPKGATSGELQKATGADQKTISGAIKHLIGQGLVQAAGIRRGTRYHLAQAAVAAE